ncbi:MAG: NAD-dependent epimerase/dehydratase family protein [Bacilli bacterium]
MNGKKKILVTGAAGFIGYFLTARLLSDPNNECVGVDNLNDYYDTRLKDTRLSLLLANKRFSFYKGDIADSAFVNQIFDSHKFDVVINLAAQAGVRYSLENPKAYIHSNVSGFLNILEACRNHTVSHLVFASSSSVYGSNKKVPYSTSDKTDSPVSLYAATKKANELMSYAYSKLYGIPCTGLRFFTVYGPMGRPDMAYFKFTNKIIKGEKIQVYNNGIMYRDFTYIDDTIDGIIKAMELPPKPNQECVRHKIYNIGNNKPESLLRFIEILENCLVKEGVINKPVEKEFLPMQPGDVFQTYADVDDLINDFGWAPSTKLEDGLTKFVRWYKKFYNL